MRVFSKKISLYVGVVIGFVITLQAFQGNFKTCWPGKQVRISKSSQHFLSKTLPVLQQFCSSINTIKATDLTNKLHVLQISRSWLSSDVMADKDVELFVQLVADHGQLISYQSNVSKPKKNQKKYIGSLAKIFSENLKQVFIGTAQQELDQILKLLEYLECGCELSEITHKQLWSSIGVLLDLMHHFDGVSVIEYDFLVLGELVLFFELLVMM